MTKPAMGKLALRVPDLPFSSITKGDHAFVLYRFTNLIPHLMWCLSGVAFWRPPAAC